ncbi:hypothetical protein [Mesorhizobium onobrychidis]|nr:hypothetical protein [Mesorhizobium onobrychidis]
MDRAQVGEIEANSKENVRFSGGRQAARFRYEIQGQIAPLRSA